jgi:hypothetical protein
MSTSHLTTSEVRYHEIKPGYRVGDDGAVWSQVYPAGPGKRRLGEWRQLKPTPQYRGHMTVYLGRKDQRFVHRLVLEAFVGPCPEGMECRHKDGNPGNNRLDNLAWGTRKENHADSVEHGTAYFLPGMDAPNRVIDETDVRAILGLWREGKAMGVIAGLFNIHETNVHSIVTGRSWSSLTGIVYDPKPIGRKGEKRNKLTDEQVVMIRAADLSRRGATSELAKMLGVTPTAIRLIATGKRKCSLL